MRSPRLQVSVKRCSSGATGVSFERRNSGAAFNNVHTAAPLLASIHQQLAHTSPRYSIRTAGVDISTGLFADVVLSRWHCEAIANDTRDNAQNLAGGSARRF